MFSDGFEDSMFKPLVFDGKAVNLIIIIIILFV